MTGNFQSIRALLFFIFSALLIVTNSSDSQSFTKVTTGPFTVDRAASRSVNFVDYDGDGYLDLFVSNGKRFGQRSFLYKNIGGNFTRIFGNAIVNDSLPFDGASWADFDNDGLPDMCVVTWYDSTNRVYHNDGNGNFTLLSSSRIVTDRGFSETCSWGDYDNDGLVDLLVTNSEGVNKKNFLYKNTGGGNFVRIDTGIVSTEVNNKCRGVNWIDIDGDGKLDLYICCEGNQNNLCYKNNGGGYFTKITSGAFVNDGGESWSGSWGDYDNDGDPDLFVANNVNQKDCLYRNDGNFNFTKVLSDTVVNEPGFHACGIWGDFDNDGDLDLFVTQAYSSNNTQLKNLLYKNMLMETGTASFQKISTGDIVNDLGFSYGVAAADWNKDGFLDIFVAKTYGENENNAAYLNNTNSNKWIELRCKGTASNRSAIGTRVRIKSTINGNSVWQLRAVEGQSGYCGQTLDLHFGLGNATIIDSLKVEWPSGNVNYYTNIGVNQIADLIENTGIFGVIQTGTNIPEKFVLGQNYPNPFNPSTKIGFEIPPFTEGGFVMLTIYDSVGREVEVLVNSALKPGSYEASWNATNYPSGVYFYKLSGTSFSESKKMILVK